jgi:hypothetical protein
MVKVKIKYPEHTPENRRRILAELKEQTDSNEGLESLVAQMNDFEAEYGMSTVEFYAQFAAGKMGDSRDFIKWAGIFKLYQRLLQTHFSHAEVA